VGHVEFYEGNMNYSLKVPKKENKRRTMIPKSYSYINQWSVAQRNEGEKVRDIVRSIENE
jgi:hypothetical protein